jgi:signal transduction histidine kinase
MSIRQYVKAWWVERCSPCRRRRSWVRSVLSPLLESIDVRRTVRLSAGVAAHPSASVGSQRSDRHGTRGSPVAHVTLARRLAIALGGFAALALLGWTGGLGALVDSPSRLASIDPTMPVVFLLGAVIGAWLLNRISAADRYSGAERRSAVEQRLAARTRSLERADRQLCEEASVASDLTSVGAELIASLDGAEMLDRLCRATQAALDADYSHAFLWRPEAAAFVPVAGHGDSAEQWEALRTLTVPRDMVSGLLARLEHEDVVQVRMSDRQDLIPAALPRWFGITVSLYMALRRGRQIVGVLTVGYRGRQERFDARQERSARAIAQLASLALETTRLFEQLRRANHLKSEFVATISHELRTPLHHIIGFTGLLRDGEFDAPTAAQSRALAQVDRAANQLLELLERILDLSRLEREHVALEIGDVGADRLANELAAFAATLQHSSPVRFSCHVDPDVQPLRSDEAKLKVVLKQLLENAFKFTHDGTIALSVRPFLNGIEFAVSDTGIGIAAEDQRVIFHPFRQLEPHLTRRYKGLGLGLYIASRLLEMLRGTITVDSALGRGSTFRVWVPNAEPKRSYRRPHRYRSAQHNGLLRSGSGSRIAKG